MNKIEETIIEGNHIIQSSQILISNSKRRIDESKVAIE